jgi:molybdopterin/thiamine biosynthesis adenylyltransferase
MTMIKENTTPSLTKISKEELYYRQFGIVNPEKLGKVKIDMIGAGSVGSFTALALSKMGVERLGIWDFDEIESINLPSQFYPKNSLGEFKVDALKKVVSQFNPTTKVVAQKKPYNSQKLTGNIIIAATDNMQSRKLAYEEACKRGAIFIDSRMGAELAIVYKIDTTKAEDRAFYEDSLYSDEEADEAPCTAKVIIYNVMMIASLICRAVKAEVNKEKYPRETVFNMTEMTDISWMIQE